MARQAEVWLKVGVRLLVAGDPSVQHVTIEAGQRLDGYRATAGAFLSQFSVSFAAYLQQYEAKWKVIVSIEELSEYPTRPLYITGEPVFMQIEQNVRAVHLLRFSPYLDHQDIWYELLHGGRGGNQSDDEDIRRRPRLLIDKVFVNR